MAVSIQTWDFVGRTVACDRILVTIESIAIIVPQCHKPMCSWEDFLEVVYSGRKYCRFWATKRSLTRWMMKGLIWKLHTGRCAVFLLLGMRLVLKLFLAIRFWEATKWFRVYFDNSLSLKRFPKVDDTIPVRGLHTECWDSCVSPRDPCEMQPC